MFRVEKRMSQKLVKRIAKKVSRSCVARDIKELSTTAIDYRVCVAPGKLGRVVESHGKAQKSIGSYADILLAHHAIVGQERLRDEPRVCLCRRLKKRANSVNSTYVHTI